MEEDIFCSRKLRFMGTSSDFRKGRNSSTVRIGENFYNLSYVFG